MRGVPHAVRDVTYGVHDGIWGASFNLRLVPYVIHLILFATYAGYTVSHAGRTFPM